MNGVVPFGFFIWGQHNKIALGKLQHRVTEPLSLALACTNRQQALGRKFDFVAAAHVLNGFTSEMNVRIQGHKSMAKQYLAITSRIVYMLLPLQRNKRCKQPSKPKYEDCEKLHWPIRVRTVRRCHCEKRKVSNSTHIHTYINLHRKFEPVRWQLL